MGNIKESSHNTSEKLSQGFSSLSIQDLDESIFSQLENTLEKCGFNLADTNSLSEIFNESHLVCRSESFTKVIDLISENKTIEIHDTSGEANMCSMSSADGYRTAMVEGFSGKDVSNRVKVVITFSPNHVSTERISKDSSLWELKPKTAEVSLSGKGKIDSEDIEMVSFRFPASYYPEGFLSESEKDSLDENEIQFIVRHYIKEKNVH